MRLRGSGGQQDPVRARPVPSRDQSPQLRRAVTKRPVEVEVLGQALAEAVEAELADVRIGDVQPGAVDLLVRQEVFEGREFHRGGAAGPQYPCNFCLFRSDSADKKRSSPKRSRR